MRTVIFISTILLLISCSDKIPDKKEISKTTFFYVIESDRRYFKYDTVHRSKMLAPDTADIPVARGGFVYKDKEHIITVYTNDNYAPTDGGRLYYVLDTFGILFSRSTTWSGCTRLHSSNDSINDILSQAFAHILSKPELHAYQSRRYDQSPEVILVPK